MKARQYLGAVLVIAVACGGPALAAASPTGGHTKAHKKTHPSFSELDKNHDGVITKDEWRGSAKSFARHDLDHDGKLTPKEYPSPQKAKDRG